MVSVSSGAMAVRMRHFENPFDDYSVKSAESVITRNKISSNSSIVTELESKWAKTIRKFQNLDFRDTSVYTGTSGVALLKLLKNPNDESNLMEIKELLDLKHLKHRRHTFLCGDAGPLAIGAVVCNKLGETDEMKHLIQKLLRMQGDAVNPSSGLPDEYLYGRAGYLFALLYVNKHIEPPPVPSNTIRQVIEAILTSGKEGARSGSFECPLMYQWHDSYYLGAAHGVSGIMYLLLQAKEFLTDTEINSLIKPTIDYMARLRFRSGNYPSSLGSDNDKYIQWCHGAPGFVYLFSIAHKVFGDSKYLKLALEAGEVIWKRGLVKKGYSICHGVSGNAYCFLELYQTTKDEKHLYRAIKFAEWCINYTKDHEEHSPDRPLSLFEGIAGPMYLLLDIQKPMEAKFPGFTL
ncbi:hypothetical protein ILUMI_10474 [Ignelater luminosus]|uniref:LanC-like protein 2 n=1 Tax=Ignelater luminosus TaxID=2038154 RepID=A0A8K0GDL1_IGNLU|nr:hypothetical protein ILUMI_10474 [Ignelater luminosus]